MFYISPKLTLLMLTVVPPVSLGAVSDIACLHGGPSADFRQVFYGRYLKRLSNKTQEALGEMTKVCSSFVSSSNTDHSRRLRKSL